MDQVTRDFYDGDPEGYAESTFGNDVSDLRRRFLEHLDPGARILDLGCGSGRDTIAFRDAGYEVVPVDGSEGMCRVASANTGDSVRCLDFMDLDYIEEFDGVWACASMLHLHPEEISDVTALVRRALRCGGVFYTSFKSGGFAGYREGRWYTDVRPDGLRSMASSSGFDVLDVWSTVDPRGTVWTNALFGKPGCFDDRTIMFASPI